MNKTYEELFGEDNEYGKQYPSYDAIVNGIGTVVIEESVGSYQGDTFYLLEKDGQFGYLEIGWGSCSGCDSLEGCHSKADVMQLAESIEESVTWRSKDETREWFQTHDWAGSWSFGYNRSFVKQCWEFLGCEGSVPTKRE